MNEKQQDCKPCPEGRIRNKTGKCVMPEVTFAGFILSLNTTALFHLGELSHPETGEKVVDLDLVKNAIDTITLLRDKTTGNLDKEEQELIANVLYDLKLRYVNASDKSLRTTD